MTKLIFQKKEFPGGVSKGIAVLNKRLTVEKKLKNLNLQLKKN